MRRPSQLAATALVLLALSPAAAQQQGGFRPFQQDGVDAYGQVILCPTGVGREVTACGSVANPLRATIAPSPEAAGGATVFRVATTDGTNPTVVKAAPGRLYAYQFCNVAQTARYVRFHNTAAAPAPGTTPIAAGPMIVTAGACQQMSTDIGLSFPVGIAFSVTGDPDDTDATPVAEGDVTGFVGYR